MVLLVHDTHSSRDCIFSGDEIELNEVEQCRGIDALGVDLRYPLLSHMTQDRAVLFAPRFFRQEPVIEDLHRVSPTPWARDTDGTVFRFQTARPVKPQQTLLRVDLHT